MSRSIAQGLGGGAIAASGLAAGSLVHVAAAALGLSAVFHHLPAAYTALKLLGAAYLIYLGIQHLRGAKRARGPWAGVCSDVRSRPGLRIFTESILVEMLNPKTALFFLAFLPQFVDMSRGPPAPQILVLGCIVSLSAIPCDLVVALVSGSAARAVSENPRLARVREYLAGSLLVGMGLYVVESERVG